MAPSPSSAGDYEHQRDTLIAYLLVKVAQADWHGVRDAAVDIELLEVRIECLKPVK